MEGMSCNCILGSDMLSFAGPLINYPDSSITFENLSENIVKGSEEISINCEESKLSVAEQRKIQEVVNKFKALFSDTPGYTNVLSREIVTVDNQLIKQKFYRYVKTKTEIIE